MQAVRVAGEPEVGGSEDAALFARLYPALRRFAAVTAPDADPDDLVQEAVARTLRRQPLNALDHPAAYLRRTIVHLASNRRRGFARWRSALARLGRADDSYPPQYASDLTDLLHLSPDDRALLWLVEVEGCTYAEAANQLGITEDAARQRAARARRRLRHELEEEKDHQ
jgi:RNA polymerase sigma-70 factor, ECF subfamily